MDVVDGGQDAPHAVHLAVVAIDLADEQEDGEQGDGENEGGHEGVGGEVELLVYLNVGEVLDGGARERAFPKVAKMREHRLREVS